MIKITAFILRSIGELPGLTNECLYIISYNNHIMYIGQATGSSGYRPACRICRHLGFDIGSCMRVNDRSGASRQFHLMYSKLPIDVQDDFVITLLSPHDLSYFVDLDSPEIRLKMIGSGISIDDIYKNKRTKKVINFCETVLAWSLCPVYDKSHNSRCSNGLPEELMEYLLT